MKTLTHNQLRDLLLRLKSATPLTISSLTGVKSSYGKPLFKLARINGMACADYSRAMNRLTPFVPKPRQWGKRISPAVVEHVTADGIKHYLTLKVERELSSVYLARHGSLLKVIEKSALEEMIRERAERPVTVRDYSLSNIKRISIGGERYRIVENIS